MNKVFYDEALSKFADIIFNNLGISAFEKNFFLRDAQGKLTFIINDETVTHQQRQEISNTVSLTLSSYIDEGYALATPKELFDDTLLDPGNIIIIKLVIDNFSVDVKLLERRMVGSDWLLNVNEKKEKPSVIVFSSIKGGVGRTTAICVIASNFARQGKRVLTIDMDLEAPGLGSMLLKDDVVPKFGLLDYFVESNMDNVDENFYVELIGSSWLSQGKGRIDVIPALGKSSLDNPENVLGKISRAYMSDIDSSTSSSSFMAHLQRLIDFYSVGNRYDLILIDARSGLHETTASVLIGLGANVFFFGMNQPQTLVGFDLLFSHLSVFNVANEAWAERLKFIHAKADLDNSNEFPEIIEGRIKKYFYQKNILEPNIDITELRDTFDVEWTNEEDESLEAITDSIEDNYHVITISNDLAFHEFDPVSNPAVLSSDACHIVFGSLLNEVDSIIKGSNFTEVDFD